MRECSKYFFIKILTNNIFLEKKQGKNLIAKKVDISDILRFSKYFEIFLDFRDSEHLNFSHSQKKYRGEPFACT